MTKQCPSCGGDCGGDCGRTAKSGCMYGTSPDLPVFSRCSKCGHHSVDQSVCYYCKEPFKVAEPNVIPGGFKKSALSALQKTIKREVLEYAGRISLAEAIGVLEVVKHDLIEEHRE